MPISTIIEGDLICIGCKYNLHGLDYSQKCPECGREIFHTTAAGVRSYFLASVGGDRRPSAELLDRFARTVGVTADGMNVILDASRLASEKRNRPRTGWRSFFHREPKHTCAIDICNALKALVRNYFNDPSEARELLTEWGIGRSEDVGRVMFGLVDAGVIQASPDDQESDFAGLFTIDDWVSNWESAADRGSGSGESDGTNDPR